MNTLPIFASSWFDGAGAAGDARIVDQDVEPAFAGQHVGEKRLPGDIRGHVVMHERPVALDFLRVGHDDDGAVGGQQGCRGRTDAGSAAGDDCHLSG